MFIMKFYIYIYIYIQSCLLCKMFFCVLVRCLLVPLGVCVPQVGATGPLYLILLEGFSLVVVEETQVGPSDTVYRLPRYLK
jgi:hypothetical protein